jgi:diguanylate cyclase (GGDEF)-like protein
VLAGDGAPMRGTSDTAPSIGEAGLLKVALDSMPYGFSIWDEDRRLVLFNWHYLEMYRFDPAILVRGTTLREVCAITVGLGNHPDISAEDLFAAYGKRLDATRAAAPEPVVTQKAIRGRVINTTHHWSEGLGWIVIHEDVTDATEQQWMADLREKSLATQNNRFNAALNSMSHGLSMYDGEWRLVTCNQRYLDIYGLSAEFARPGTPFQKIIDQRRDSGTVPVDVEGDFAEHVLQTSNPVGRKVQTYRLATGQVVQVTQSPVDGGGFVAIHQDITDDVARLEALQESREEVARQNARFDAAVNNMSQGLCMFDHDERLVICNDPYARIYNLPPELMEPGTTLSQILEYRFAHGMVPKLGREHYLQSRRRLHEEAVEAKDEIEMENGRVIAVQHHPMQDGGWVATHEDVTEQRRIEARVRHLARHDALTDLPNRVFLREEMEKLQARIERKENVAVLCLDLDHFKAVNDTLGHGIGDQVLVTVAQRLKECSRETDVVARLGGDEFAILVQSLEDPRGAAAMAARIVKSVAQPMDLDGHLVSIGTSVGIALAPGDGHDAETLLKNADLALYRAKSEGRGNYHFFEKGMDEALQHRRMLEQGLKVALARNEFRLMYQPLLNLADNRVCSFEALLRWDHPERGLISPADFIPVAEETGMISPIGEWVLKQACKVAATWPEHVRIAVNLSAAQFKSRALVNHVVTALEEAGLDARRLELEVTESLLLADTEVTLQTLHKLRELGVRISMDDFGTGYSSLSYLRSFPFDKIKIDRSFMDGLGPDDDSMAIIRAVIGLGQSLGMSTTAEGIETEDQLKAVRDQGCNEVQGFLFSPPLPASGVAALLGTIDQPMVPRRRRDA